MWLLVLLRLALLLRQRLGWIHHPRRRLLLLPLLLLLHSTHPLLQRLHLGLLSCLMHLGPQLHHLCSDSGVVCLLFGGPLLQCLHAIGQILLGVSRLSHDVVLLEPPEVFRYTSSGLSQRCHLPYATLVDVRASVPQSGHLLAQLLEVFP
jgi:hypothetical protein